ncbi:MAG: hypothetical protein GJ676_01325 [Rhodobacteraceae bacterium]|nr:hypothetical protein [Paracoccaceae bacterium]
MFRGKNLLADQLHLTPLSGTILIVVAVLAGTRYRSVWKSEGPRWQLWLFGLIAAGCLLTLGFLPLKTG